MKRALHKKTAFKFLLTAGTVAILAACSTMSSPVPSLRTVTARQLAASAAMTESHIQAGEFTIMAFEKVHAKGKPAMLYIEDDGNLSFSSDMTIWGDPTPSTPYALQMAADDASPNVIWLARPCQYTGATNARACNKALYTTHRFSPQVIDAMSAALDSMKDRYHITSFNITGIGGGAAIAVELAAVRNDVTFLKTIGGVLDTNIMQQGDKNQPYAGSLNPVDAAPKVAHIPQQHSVGAWDLNKTLTMIENFRAAQGNPSTAKIGPAYPNIPAPSQGDMSMGDMSKVDMSSSNPSMTKDADRAPMPLQQ